MPSSPTQQEETKTVFVLRETTKEELVDRYRVKRYLPVAYGHSQPHPEGNCVRLSDLPKIIEQVRSQECQRVREALIGKDAMLAWQDRALLVTPETFERIFAALEAEQPALSAERDPREEETWPDSPSLNTAEEAERHQPALRSEPFLRALDSVLGPIYMEDDAPCLDDYRRAVEAGLAALSEGVGSGAGEAESWLLGPGGQVVDGPAVRENIAVVPQHVLHAAEERLKEIARGESEPWRRRNAEAVALARDYFEGRTVVMEQAPPPQAVQGEDDGWPEFVAVALAPDDGINTAHTPKGIKALSRRQPVRIYTQAPLCDSGLERA